MHEQRSRDLLLDLARAGALGVVVIWHWVFSTVALHDNGPSIGNPVGDTPGLWLATWFLQPMAVFFAVGGLLHLRGYQREPRAFVRRRLQRLLVPALPLLVPAALAIVVAHALGQGAVVKTIVLMISPLWFLAVYVCLVAITPLAVEVHQRSPGGALLLLGGVVVCIDVARFTLGIEGPMMVVIGFVAVWALVHQLGFSFDALRQRAPAERLAVAIAGFMALATAIWVGPYSSSMVGVPGEAVSNMAPPNVAVVCLAVMQLGLLAFFAERLEAFAERRRGVLEVAGRWSMTVYVWHLLAWGICFALIRTIGIAVPSDPGAAWWLQRPLWLLGPAAVAVPLCRVMRRFDRTQMTSSPTGSPSIITSAVPATTGGETGTSPATTTAGCSAGTGATGVAPMAASLS
jgi:fucose 4-O-acetylase-like acetyltransferase